MSDQKYPNLATIAWHEARIASIAEKIDEWFAVTPCDGVENLPSLHPLGWVTLRKWVIANDRAGQAIVIYEDGSISIVVELAQRRFPWNKREVVETRKRFPLRPDKIPLTPRVLDTLGIIARTLRARSPRHFA